MLRKASVVPKVFEAQRCLNLQHNKVKTGKLNPEGQALLPPNLPCSRHKDTVKPSTLSFRLFALQTTPYALKGGNEIKEQKGRSESV